jgi:hypothetical protein
MTSNLRSSVLPVSPEPQASRRRAAPQGWLKIGTVAAASAVLGGLAAAWFYRKALSQLREAENEIPNSDFGITEDESAEDF